MMSRFTEKNTWGENKWWKRNKGNVALAIIFLIMVTVITIVLYGLIVSNEATEACYAAGYSEMRKVGGGDYYCYRRVNGTDEIVPLEDIDQ